ncbi:CUB-like domain-containing protein [Caenorhabditis elegans]|uniref:CUB-like domain-containing protein n=1 Tax=Caenorhabditis elegans TaxID=6239 RepID=Q19223_CAEEL|nr:CUB-like domain-containing protein [Caenorhabditis elegans]CAA94586.1 CUB-like domain-containing protein [Caenorhabditis elegans]|eukprot:NP_502374.1 Infection Response Gene [Caenorhabditis elegans]
MKTLLWFLVFVGVSNALDCTQIPAGGIVPRHNATIPAGAKEPVLIPPNFNCLYNIKVPAMVYARVVLENGLNGNNDQITVTNEQNAKTFINSRSGKYATFYVFPNTLTSFLVSTKSVNMHSSFRMVVDYYSLNNATVTYLDNPDMQYSRLYTLQAEIGWSPRTIVAKERMSISIAYSGWTPYDNLYNFFLIEGDLENPLAIYRMTQFLYQNYISKGNKVTVLGLDNTFSRSSIVFVPLSQAQQYDSYTAASGYMNLNQVDIDATVGEKKKKIVTMISMRDYVMIWKMEKTSNPDCVLKAITSPPTSESKVLLDFSVETQFPTNITRPSFCIIAENCAASIQFIVL